MPAAISADKVLDVAHSFVSLGLREAGYEYVNIDVYVIFCLPLIAVS
jgi:hypothetical protein